MTPPYFLFMVSVPLCLIDVVVRLHRSSMSSNVTCLPFRRFFTVTCRKASSSLMAQRRTRRLDTETVPLSVSLPYAFSPH